MAGLAGKAGVVTGGGRGIGLAVAHALARQGVRLALAARSADQLRRAAAQVSSAVPSAEAWPVECDVASPGSVEAVAGALVERWGGVDILVNAAGVAESAPIARTTDEIWNRMISVNLTGTFLMTRSLIPGMVERGWGRIVNVASTAGRVGFPYVSAYAASKHGVVGLTRSVALEVAGKGVTVNSVCPGYVETDMTARTIENIVRTTGRDRAEARRALEEASPQRRILRPEEVADLVAVLCRPESAGINGQALVLDGGGVQA